MLSSDQKKEEEMLLLRLLFLTPPRDKSQKRPYNHMIMINHSSKKFTARVQTTAVAKRSENSYQCKFAKFFGQQSWEKFNK